MKRTTNPAVAMLAAALTAAVGGTARSAEPPLGPGEVFTTTFSIVAVDPDGGECGAAVASMYPDVGHVVPYVRAGVGAFCTQHYGVPKWGEPALDRLAAGDPPGEVLAKLLADDDRPEQRQLAIIDLRGRAALHHPTEAGPRSSYWGAYLGRNFACQGNTLTGREVIVAMAAAFEETKGSLADRLVASLVAGDCAGGDHRGRLAAAVRVAKVEHEGDYLALDTDQSEDAVIELLKAYVELGDHPAKGAWRGGRAPFVHPCDDRPEPVAPPEARE